MTDWLLTRFSDLVYVRIGLNRIIMTRASDGKEVVSRSGRKFANSRIAIADFLVAQEVMTETKMKLMEDRPFGIAVKMVIHQTVMNEGGLSGVERRVLRDTACCAGAREVYLWEGGELSLSEMKNRNWKEFDGE